MGLQTRRMSIPCTLTTLSFYPLPLSFCLLVSSPLLAQFHFYSHDMLKKWFVYLLQKKKNYDLQMTNMVFIFQVWLIHLVWSLVVSIFLQIMEFHSLELKFWQIIRNVLSFVDYYE